MPCALGPGRKIAQRRVRALEVRLLDSESRLRLREIITRGAARPAPPALRVPQQRLTHRHTALQHRLPIGHPLRRIPLAEPRDLALHLLDAVGGDRRVRRIVAAKSVER